VNKHSSFQLLRLTLAATTLWLCCGALVSADQMSANDLTLESFQKFDQSLDTGWRVLQVQRDYRGAAKAILDYISVHSATLKPWQKASLAFHLGHVYALAGERDQAIRWFRKSIDGHRLGNPEYVESFIAFLQNDKPALIADRRIVANTNPGAWRTHDLGEMDAMLEYFGEPFEAAWGAYTCHIQRTENTGPAWVPYCKVVDTKYRDIYLEHGIKLQSE
jgi:tetratricopeptide (TPR) repeat protein